MGRSQLRAALLLAGLLAGGRVGAGPADVLRGLEEVKAAITRTGMVLLQANFIQEEGDLLVDLHILAGEHPAWLQLLADLESRTSRDVLELEIRDEFKDIRVRILYKDRPPGARPRLHGALEALGPQVLWRKTLHDERSVERFVAKLLIVDRERSLRLEGFVVDLAHFTRLLETLEGIGTLSPLVPLGIRTRKSNDFLIYETGVQAVVGSAGGPLGGTGSVTPRH